MNTLRPFCAHQRGKRFVAQAAAGLQRVFKMQFDGVRFLFAQGDGDGHLRHDRRAAAADLAFVEQQHRCARARRGDGRVHPGAAGADDQHIGG